MSHKFTQPNEAKKMKPIKTPERIIHYFEKHRVEFKVDTFEEYMLNDIYQHDESAKIKLNRDVTEDFINGIHQFLEDKRNIRYSTKGGTRDGKSLAMLKIGDIILSYNKIDFNENIGKTVCGNQIEYRLKLKNAQFGDFFLVDENFFGGQGIGSGIEMNQLKDVNAQIAKENISVVYINPEKFLNVGATLGLATYGRDSKNWLTRFLVYKFKDNYPYLIGYIGSDVGDLFRKYGCFIYQFSGGCTNSKRLTVNNLPKDILEESICIPDEFIKDPEKAQKKVILDKKGLPKSCPFYEVCTHGLCMYEHKKDTWIAKEMGGGMDDRTLERFKVAVQLIFTLEPSYSLKSDSLTLKAKNGKDLKNRVRLRLHKYTNTKFGVAEFDELIEMIKTNTDLNMFMETLKTVNDDKLLDKFFNLRIVEDSDNTVPDDFLKSRYNDFLKGQEDE